MFNYICVSIGGAFESAHRFFYVMFTVDLRQQDDVE